MASGKHKKYIQPKRYNPEVMARKIEESKRVITKLETSFDHKYSALESFIALLVNFASHDIKNAVHNLDGLVSTITPNNLGESEIASMKFCIDNIRNTLEKFSEFNVNRKHNSFELSKLFASLEILNRPYFRLNNVNFKIDYIGVSDQIVVNHDFQFIMYMLNNLMINSITALKTITGNKKVGIKVLPNDDYSIIIMFCDNGSGIKPEHRGKIWDPYFTTKENGSGIGLTHVRYVMSELKGEVTLLEDYIEGFTTVFKIKLPLSSHETPTSNN